MEKECLGCHKPNTDDCLTKDGLCFDCDVEKIELIVPRDEFDAITDQLMMAQAKSRSNEAKN
jgi:hypothetical protein